MDFFAYGSLTFAEVIAAVTGEKHSGTEATLSGFARYRVSGATYPGLIRSVGDSVDGILYADVDSVSFDCLDKFEGKYYKRQSVDVVTEQNSKRSAETYIIRREFEHLLSQEPWDSVHFRQNHLNAFLSSYQGFNWMSH